MSFKIPGFVEKRLFDEGQWVEAGKVVALLDTSDLLCDVQARHADVALAQAAKDEVDNGSRPEEIAAARAAKDKAEHAWLDAKAGSREPGNRRRRGGRRRRPGRRGPAPQRTVARGPSARRNPASPSRTTTAPSRFTKWPSSG